MSLKTLITVITILSSSVAMTVCKRNEGVSRQQASPAVTTTVVPVAASATPASPSAIRLIDFANFTYPAKSAFFNGIKSFTLRHGKYGGDGRHDPVNLAYLKYDDVTSDADEEAIVILEVSVKGTAIPHIVYIYGLENDKPKLLWVFETGDRADGGLRQIYAENGHLVIELYGNNKLIGNELYGMEEGVCCPKVFTRAHYEWHVKSFMRIGQQEVLPNPGNQGAPVMESYWTAPHK